MMAGLTRNVEVGRFAQFKCDNLVADFIFYSQCGIGYTATTDTLLLDIIRKSETLFLWPFLVDQVLQVIHSYSESSLLIDEVSKLCIVYQIFTT